MMHCVYYFKIFCTIPLKPFIIIYFPLSPCEGYACMDMASCVDISSDEDPQTNCVCQLGRVMNEAGDECIIPLPTTPTPRPAPSSAPAVKMATTAVKLIVLLHRCKWV